MKKGALLSALASGISVASPTAVGAATFEEDLKFLKQHTKVVVLSDAAGQAKVAVVPAWQGRIMTSTSSGDSGASYGWVNRDLIASGKFQPHINVFGGEDRFWLGPEGGQFSIFFAKGAKFELSDWFTPAPIDTEPFTLVKHNSSEAEFAAQFRLTNYSGTTFDVKVNRQVKLLTAGAGMKALGFNRLSNLEVVAFESVNKISNAGKSAWKKDSGLLSVWILGMFNPSPATTIVAPIQPGPDEQLGRRVTSDYFGEVPADRLVVKDDVIFFSGDGQYRSKIGISPRRSRAVLGSYDAQNKVLTVVQFTQPKGQTDYVNSLWKLQDDPYSGDAANSYNDGPPSPGAKPLGPFYELESSSPAAALAPGKSLTHVHRTIHLKGAEAQLDAVCQAVLKVSLAQVQGAFRR
jgi:hypothetical protein